ncbi:hypothetical protein FBU30_010671 [Linnemannia zychae]|nr:hypothetical protein FBU30_010671 [Linnemannia zychae]
MIPTRHPPIFTSHGYQPSIFMAASPKPSISVRQRRIRQVQEISPASVLTSPSIPQSSSQYSHADCTLVRVNIQISEQGRIVFEPPPVHVPYFMPEPSASVAVIDIPRQELQQELAMTPSWSDSSMDIDAASWITCPSSPMSVMSRTVPNWDWRSLSPAPQIVEFVMPMTMAFQQHLMLPEFPFQGRSRCIFLGDRSADHRVNSRVRDLLHNTSVQKIRTWLHETIEPNAMEQWANQALFEQLSYQAGTSGSSEYTDNVATLKECPICYQVGNVFKIIVGCNHEICWKCEADLDRFENVSCPLCRGIRLTSNFRSMKDLFATTIGIRSSNYTHRLSSQISSSLEKHSSIINYAQGQHEDIIQDECYERIEHELSDRYLWEPSDSFLEYLSLMKDHPAKQYFQLFAAKDLCVQSSNDVHLREYNDEIPLNPPTSGLVLPPHRLYIALTHFCLNMLTLPNPVRFQNQRMFKHEHMLLELITLFLVPTDEFSPRRPDRIYNTCAWVTQGATILTRIRRFMSSRIARHKAATTEEGENELGVPSMPIPREILYLGVARWNWIAHSLSIIMTWLRLADSNPSMVPPLACSYHSQLGKHHDAQFDPDPRPTKRARHN